MHFGTAIALARDTPTGALCEAWEVTPEHVASRKSGESPMTLREAGDLAALHGLLLEDILGAAGV
jgi:hypothetical protein